MENVKSTKLSRGHYAIQVAIIVGLAAVLATTAFSASRGRKPATIPAHAHQEQTALDHTSVITVGIAADLSGPAGDHGWRQANAVQLAISQTNAGGGIDIGGVSHILTVVTADSRCDATTAVLAANALLNADAVAVIGHTCSNASLAAQPIYGEAGVPMVSPSSSAVALTEQGYTNTFRVHPRDDAPAILLAAHFRQWLGLERTGIVESSAALGSPDQASAFSNAFTGLGGTVVGHVAVASTAEYPSVLTTIQAEDPDAIFYADQDPNNAGLLSRVADDLGMGDVVIGWDLVWGSRSALAGYAVAAGGAAEGDYAAINGRSTEDMPGYGDLNVAYQAAGFPNSGDEAQESGAFAYDAAKIIIEAIDLAQSTDPGAIRDGIAALTNYAGVVGTYVGFDEKGDVVPQWSWMERYRDGQWVVVQPSKVYLPLVASNYKAPSGLLNLGILGPFSGPSSRTGEEFRCAVSMAFDAIGWRIGDYQIKPVWIDSESDPAKAAQNYEEAILQDGVEAGLLNWHSSVGVACMEVVADYQIPHFAGFAATDVVNDIFSSDRERYGYWTTKWWPTPTKLSVGYVQALEHAISSGAWTPTAKTVVITGEDTGWGRMFGEAIKGHFEDAGWSVLGEQYFAPGQTDFSAALALLKALDPTVIAGTSFSSESVFALINQADAAGLDSVIIADGLEWLGNWYSETGDSSNYILDQMAVWATDEGEAFRQAFEDRYGISPSPSAGGLAFDAANFFIGIAEAAYQEAGELSSEALYDFVQEEVWTGQWTYADGIVMQVYKYTEETIPDPVVGSGYYLFPILQYFDGEGKIVFPADWADQPFTPPGN